MTFLYPFSVIHLSWKLIGYGTPDPSSLFSLLIIASLARNMATTCSHGIPMPHQVLSQFKTPMSRLFMFLKTLPHRTCPHQPSHLHRPQQTTRVNPPASQTPPFAAQDQIRAAESISAAGFQDKDEMVTAPEPIVSDF